MQPFCGKILKILAAFELVMATNLQGSMIPVWTPFSQITDIRSSTPLTPFGILEKSSFPSSFCALLKVQLSLPVTWRASLRCEMALINDVR